MRRILALNVDAAFPPEKARERGAWLTSLAGPGWTVEVRAIPYGPLHLERTPDQIMAGPVILEAVARAEEDGFGAVVLLCMTDPALDACREMAGIPVVGAAQASYLLAATLGGRFTVISLSAAIAPLIERTALASGVDRSRLVSVRAVEMTIPEMASDRERLYTRLLDQAGLAVERDGASVVVLGCTGMAGLAERLGAELGLPVVDPNLAGLTLAMSLLTAGLGPSRATYPGLAGGWATVKARSRPRPGEG